MSRRIVFGIVVLAALCAGGAWYFLARSSLPESIAHGNGRIEAEEVQVATKYPGRLLEVLVEEGDLVSEGQLLARMDTEELNAQIAQAEAEVTRYERVAEQAQAAASQAAAELKLAEKELERESELFEKGYTTEEKLDLRRTRRDSLLAARSQAEANIGSAEAAIQSARASVARLKTLLKDAELKAPVQGRILYRLAEPGEILGGGGRVLTILDVTDVYMTIFLPAEQAGRLAFGSQARLILDPLPDRPVPATVSFVSPQAQFTPKQVETKDERQKLMFRVKLQLPPELLQSNIERVKTGVRGVAYVRLDDNVAWPAWLTLKPSESGSQPPASSQ